MRSNKQTQASKTNGAKSKGPKTPNGKAHSAANANTHNLAGARNLILLSNESKTELYNHQVAFLHRFQPIDLVEYDLVQKMILASWRLRRIENMECALMELEMDRQREDLDNNFEAIPEPCRQVLALFGSTDVTATHNLLLRYAAAARRAYASAYKILKDLQGNRFNQPSPNAPAFASNDAEVPFLNNGETQTQTERQSADSPEAAHAEEANATYNGPAPSHHENTKRQQSLPIAIALVRRHVFQSQPLATASQAQITKLPSEPKTAIAGRSFAA